MKVLTSALAAAPQFPLEAERACGPISLHLQLCQGKSDALRETNSNDRIRSPLTGKKVATRCDS